MNYNWQAALLFLAAVVAVTVIGKQLVFLNADLRRMRDHNREQDRLKLARAKYPPVVKQSRLVGLVANLVFIAGVLPLCVTLEAEPWWRLALDAVLILMVYDFFYYLTHRFLFHGQGYFRQVHALHHQARSPTHIDAFYVHPLETAVGLLLFMGTVPLLAVLSGPFHVAALIASYLVFVQINTINHTHVELPKFPFRTLSWITAKHHVHHESMHKGNYATITLLYDKLFGTLD